MLTGSDNTRAVDVLPLINTQDLRIEMNPLFNSIPEMISAKFDMMSVFAITMEYAIPPEIVKNNDGICSSCKKMKTIKRIQKQVAFAEMMKNVLQICVWRMELKIPAMDGGGLRWLTWLRDWIMNDFVINRKVREKGSVEM